MIIKEHASEVETVGDIQNNRIGIDTNNINYIITLLSTNLYSNPQESFLRETISNAYDSHIEAKTDLKVLLELGKRSEDTIYIRIRDFGVGISPERFNKIYKNVGSSTKRGSNEQIGGFGIGRFSALAVADTVLITSVYDGIKYSYVMYKDGNQVNIDLLSQMPTKDNTGVEIIIEQPYYTYRDYATIIVEKLQFFPNLFVINNVNGVNGFYNDIELKYYNTFAICSNYINSYSNIAKLLLGNVVYSIPQEVWKEVPSEVMSLLHDMPIFIKFEVGDLEVTPNREQILLSSSTKKAFISKFNEVYTEMIELISESIKDLSATLLGSISLRNKNYLLKLAPEFRTSVDVSVNSRTISDLLSITNLKIPSNILEDFDDYIVETSLHTINLKYIAYSSRIQSKSIRTTVTLSSLLNLKKEADYKGMYLSPYNRGFVLFCDDPNNYYVKNYLRELSDKDLFSYKEIEVFGINTFKELYWELTTYFRNSQSYRQGKTYTHKKYFTKGTTENTLFKTLMKEIFDVFNSFEIMKVSDIQDYIDNYKATRSAVIATNRAVTPKSKVNVIRYYNASYISRELFSDTLTYTSIDNFVSAIKSSASKKTIIYSPDSEFFHFILSIYTTKKVECIKVPKTKCKYLKGIKNILSFEEFIQTHNSKLKTVLTWHRYKDSIYQMDENDYSIRNSSYYWMLNNWDFITLMEPTFEIKVLVEAADLYNKLISSGCHLNNRYNRINDEDKIKFIDMLSDTLGRDEDFNLVTEIKKFYKADKRYSQYKLAFPNIQLDSYEMLFEYFLKCKHYRLGKEVYKKYLTYKYKIND